MESSLHFLSLCFCQRQHAPRTLPAGNTRTTLLCFSWRSNSSVFMPMTWGLAWHSSRFHLHIGSHPRRGLHLELQENQHQTPIDALVVSSLGGVEGLVVCCEVPHPVCPCKLETQISLYPSRPLPSSSCHLGTKVSLYSLAGFPDFSSLPAQ